LIIPGSFQRINPSINVIKQNKKIKKYGFETLKETSGGDLDLEVVKKIDSMRFKININKIKKIPEERKKIHPKME